MCASGQSLTLGAHGGKGRFRPKTIRSSLGSGMTASGLSPGWPLLAPGTAGSAIRGASLADGVNERRKSTVWLLVRQSGQPAFRPPVHKA